MDSQAFKNHISLGFIKSVFMKNLKHFSPTNLSSRLKVIKFVENFVLFNLADRFEVSSIFLITKHTWPLETNLEATDGENNKQTIWFPLQTKSVCRTYSPQISLGFPFMMSEWCFQLRCRKLPTGFIFWFPLFFRKLFDLGLKGNVCKWRHGENFQSLH